jgi:prophage tail gpP-like protein
VTADVDTRPRQHRVAVLVDGKQLDGWTAYDIKSSMLDPADSFSLERAFDRPTFDLLAPDTPIRVLIDDVTVINGFVDDRDVPEGEEMIQLSGRDRAGRLVQESAPGVDFRGAGIVDLVGKVAAPWFTTITVSNARNRRVRRGKGRKASVGAEPVTINQRVGTRIEPGQMRWAVIADLCRQAGYLCWSAGDGTELVVGQPNYDQEPQFVFFCPREGSARAGQGNVLGLGVRDSTGDRYSRILVVGSGTGTKENYGATVASRSGEARNNPARPEGDGLDFSAPKRLVIEQACQSAAEAREMAEREMARRDAAGHRLTVRAPGHGQVVAGQYPTLFAPDLLARVDDERTGIAGTYLITSCSYRSSRGGGEETVLELVRRGAALSL